MANPTLLFSSFDNSLALTDTAGVGTWTAVVPTRYDEIGAADGIWLEEATTNACFNPFVVTDTTGWGIGGGIGVGNSLSRDATKVPDSWPSNGGSILNEDVSAGIIHTDFVSNFENGAGHSQTPWTASCWVYHEEETPQDAIIEVELFNDGFGNFQLWSETIEVPIGIWTLVWVTNTPLADSTRMYAKVRSTSASMWHSGGQLENNPYPTSTCPPVNASGTVVSGGAWTGTPHASTSTRAASSASVDPTDRIDPASGSIAFRYKRLIDTGGEEVILTCGTVGSGTDYLEIGIDASDKLYMEWNSNNAGAERVTSTAANIAVNTEYLIYADWDGTTIRVSVDNGALDSDTRDAVEGDWGAGDLTISAAVGSHVVGPFAVFDRPLVTQEITNLYEMQTWRFDMLTGTSPYILTPRMNVRNNTLLRR